jgi:putative ABC transport system permease protein
VHTDSVIQDLRIGLRVLIKEKSFCTLAVAVLALGICGVTTMFGVVNAVMLRGLAFPTADRLVTANFIDPTTANLFGANGRTTSADYLELRGVQQSFERLTAYLNGSTVNMTFAGQAKRYTGVYATEDFLKCLGVAPFLGRDFTAADNAPGADKVALIGYGLWQRDFGGRSDVVGTTVRLNGKPATIIGVMPQGFAFPTNEEIWIPLFSEFPPKDRKDPTGTSPSLFGVLKPGVTIDQATAELTTIARRYAQAYPDTNKAFNTGQVQPFVVAFTGPGIRGTLWVMLAFCGGVLLIACVNVMNMQFARATLRAKELAVRSSLGATRARLIRQMLTESMLLASIGAVVGIALAYGATSWLSTSVHNLDNPPPSWIVFDVDPKALAATVLCTVIAAVMSGLLPAWMSSRASTVGVLRDAGRGNTSRSVAWISRTLVVFQIVVTCVLLIGALLQVRSIVKQGHIDYGYDTNGILSARMGLMDGDYPTQQARKIFYDHLIARLSDVPEFAAVGFTNRFRMVFSGSGPIEIEGREYSSTTTRPQANFEQVTPGFFATLSQKLLAGRNFTDQDLDARQPVAIVNTAFAEKLFGHQLAVGQRFRTAPFGGAPAGPWRMIVGEVSTVRMLGPFNNPGVDDSGFYVPYYASPFGPLQTDPAVSQFATVVIRPRAGQSVDALAGVLRREVAKADPNLPLYFVGTPASQIDTFVAQNRIIAAMFTIFGVVAVLLASVGIYGVMSFSVNQRTAEFGLRMALGANSLRILRGVLQTGAWQVGVGLTVGLGLAYVVTTLLATGIQGTLVGVSEHDATTFVSVGAVVLLVSLVAMLVPARRAMRVDPIVALRAD